MMRLGHQLLEGQSFPLTLRFEKSGTVEATVHVRKVGAMDDSGGP
jgi:copper(I)-binding protein